MTDLFDSPSAGGATVGAPESYTADDIEVLEGLEPVRRRPGMYIGGTDERALHHLVAELLDNAMDEAVAGHANRIDIMLGTDDWLTVADNGRGIPVDPHPKFPDKSALEVIMTTLHSGGKFSSKAYATAGGLHGVGVSVVNALAAELVVEVARNKTLFRQQFAKGDVQGKLENAGPVQNRRGTLVRFRPDPTIFGTKIHFRPETLYKMARSKAYLFKGVEIRWQCDEQLLAPDSNVPPRDSFHFPDGLADFLQSLLVSRERVIEPVFAGDAALADDAGRVEWAIGWPLDEEGYGGYYCNTVPTPLGGTHEAGLRGAMLKGIRGHAERAGVKKAAQITAEDLQGGAAILLSLFVKNPQFQGQTKERLVSGEVTRLVEGAVKDRFELWLGENSKTAADLLNHILMRADERLARKKSRDVARKQATRKLRLPGKLADCATEARASSEIFIVEGDSAGGSAKQARNRDNQAILPLRGKILNVVSASADKLEGNKELADLAMALGCGSGKHYRSDDLRYDKVIIMTDADVDGAHIASLLMTYFYRQMPKLIERGHLYLAQPPLYKLTAGKETAYARDDRDRDHLIETQFKSFKHVDVSRFKGLGEMNASQLKETTMDPRSRQLLRVKIEDIEGKSTAALIDDLMGRKPELRFAFIQENAGKVSELDV